MSAPRESLKIDELNEIARTEIESGRSVEVRVPASTSNLGSGFDCCGLALNLYLSVRATVRPRFSRLCEVYVNGLGNENGDVPRGRRNLIYRAMRLVAEREGISLPPLRLDVRSEIPLESGLGSSGAAIIAGISLCSSLLDLEITHERILRYATELEGHADNVAAALLGGLVINCSAADGDVIAARKRWPSDIKIIAVTPSLSVKTRHARRILPAQVSRADAVYNLQRVALFGVALESRDYDLLWEAMQDRLHQHRRAELVPGLAEALAIGRLPGLLGIALSGSGPSVVALATENFDQISNAIEERFQEHDVKTTARLLEADHLGLRTSIAAPIGRSEIGLLHDDQSS